MSINLCGIENNEKVHQRLLLFTGTIDLDSSKIKGSISVTDHEGHENSWPVAGPHFKALVQLVPGENQLTFRFQSISQNLTVNYLPLLNNQPVHLAVMIAADSPLCFDAMGQENDLNSAIKRLRMAGYLWQAFIAEQMRKAGFGRRTIRLQENWLRESILSPNNSEFGNTADVAVVRSKRTLAEIRDVDIAQQYEPKAKDPPIDTTKPSLFDLFLEALHEDGRFKGNDFIVAGLVLDTQWDKELKLVRGHAALGGGSGGEKLGIFGSHCTHAWPKCIQEVSECFTDSRSLDTHQVADELKGSGQFWNSVNIGIGAFLHELGHALGLPHTPHGIMARGFEDLNKAFMAQCPKGSCIANEDEGGAHFHRSNIIRLLLHPSLSLPGDPKKLSALQPTFYMTQEGIYVYHPHGIAMMVLWRGEEFSTHEEYLSSPPKTNVTLNPDALFSLLGERKEGVPTRLEICCLGGVSATIGNLESFCAESKSQLSACNGKVTFRSYPAGNGRPSDAKPFEILLSDSVHGEVTSIKVNAGDFLDGIHLFYSDGQSQSAGGQGGKATSINLSPGEHLIEVIVRAGFLVDGVQIVTSNNQDSSWLGGLGGSVLPLKAPIGHRITGFFGYASPSLIFSLGIIYSRCQ